MPSLPTPSRAGSLQPAAARRLSSPRTRVRIFKVSDSAREGRKCITGAGPGSPLYSLAGQAAGLFHPVAELGLVELAFVDVEVTHFGVLGGAGWNRAQRGAAEEGHLHVARETVITEEPARTFAAVEGRVVLDRLAHARHRALDDCIEATPDVAF